MKQRKMRKYRTLPYNDLGRILKDKRISCQASQSQLGYGLMDETEYSRIEQGFGSLNRYLMDFLMQRLGISSEHYEMMISQEEFEEFKAREDIRRSWNAGNYQEALTQAEQYLELPDPYGLHHQYAKEMQIRAWISLGLHGEDILEELTQAIRLTLPDFPNLNWSKSYISSSEFELMLLLIEQEQAQGIYESDLLNAIFSYVDSHPIQLQESVKFVPHLCLCQGRLHIQKGQWYQAEKVLGQGLELLWNGASCRYLIPLLEMQKEVYQYLTSMEDSTRFIKKQKENQELLDTMHNVYDLCDLSPDMLYPMMTFADSHVFNEMIYRRRKAMGLSREEFVGDWYSVQSLHSVESGQSIPRRSGNMKKMTERVNLPPAQYVTWMQGLSLEGLELVAEIRKASRNMEYGVAIEKLMYLRTFPYEDCIRNHQFLKRMETLFLYRLGEINNEQALEGFYEALYYTVPKDIKIEDWGLSSFETLILNNIGDVYNISKKTERGIEVLGSVRKSHNRSKFAPYLYSQNYAVTMGNLANYMGLNGQREEAINLHREIMKEEMEMGTIATLNSRWYGLLWNREQELINKGENPGKDEICWQWIKGIMRIAKNMKLKKRLKFYKKHLKKYTYYSN